MQPSPRSDSPPATHPDPLAGSPAPAPRASARPRGRVRAVLAAGALAAGALTATAAPAGAVSGTAESDNALAFTARLDIGDGTRSCSATLVDPEWLLTAASCFADDPAQSRAVPPGKPALKTTATIGRTDLTSSAGQVRGVVQLVPHADRDLVLARLSRPVPQIAPVALATTGPVAGEELKVAGYGRTKDEWAPLRLHSGAFSVDSVTAGEAQLTGKNGVAVCAGDTGGPALRTSGGAIELVAVNSRSWQGGCYGIDAEQTSTGAVDTRVDDLADWVRRTAQAPLVDDFDCDGVEDVAVADPSATVGGDATAGLVRVVYGGGKGTAELTQDLDSVPGESEPSDWFGEQLAVVDYDEDGCSDLVVGAPAEDIGTAKDAGTVTVLYGARAGIGKGKAALELEQGTGSGSILASAPEAGDRMGDALAAGRTADGEPYLLIGAPGEALGTVTAAGEVFYLRGGKVVSIYQGKPGVAGTYEKDDRFGDTLAADQNTIAIGIPGETVGTAAGSGNVQLLRHTFNSSGIPTGLVGLIQGSPELGGGAPEAGDEMGASVAVAAYRPAGAATATDSVVVFGLPGEALAVDGVQKADAGRVVSVRVTAAGVVSQIHNIQQGGDVQGSPETGDRYGQEVAVVNTAPREVGSDATLRLAVGAPGEAIGTTAKAGAVQTVPVFAAPGSADYWMQSGNASGLPGTPTADLAVGKTLYASTAGLWIGSPYTKPYGAAHFLPWSNATGGEKQTVTTLQPGTGGLPAAGTGFGWRVR